MHAYLIMAHNDFYILEKLLKLIDDDRNDIYLHIDKKVKNFDFNYYKNIVKKSNIFFVKRLDVRWGTYSQIKCEMELLKASAINNYKYYHLLSGVDLPLKNQNEIHNFFDKTDKEFIMFRDLNGLDNLRIDRINYYHLFFKNARSNCKFKVKTSRKMHSTFLKLQKKLKYERKKDISKYRDGANWFSITNSLVHYILENEKEINKKYKCTYCADEIFLQTLVYNSKFYKKVNSIKNDDYEGIKRAIDWKRGNPYTYKIEDFEYLINSDMFFARKFSTKVDKKIIDKIYHYVKGGVK